MMGILAEEVAKNGRDIVDVLEILALPVILSIVPFLFRQRNEAKKQAEKAVEAVTSNQTAQISILEAMESVYMNMGELKGEIKEDIKEIHEDVRFLKDEVVSVKHTINDHIENDAEFVEETREVRYQIAESIDKVSEKLDHHLSHLPGPEQPL